MEEDSAKMNHQGAESLSGSTHSLVDFNRAGLPLAEIVSEPDMRAGVEAAEYGRELQRVSSRMLEGGGGCLFFGTCVFFVALCFLYVLSWLLFFFLNACLYFL